VLIKTDRVVAGTVIVIITRLSCEYLTSPNSFKGVAFEVYDDLNSKFRRRHAFRRSTVTIWIDHFVEEGAVIEIDLANSRNARSLRRHSFKGRSTRR
jgi:hypothetical protein